MVFEEEVKKKEREREGEYSCCFCGRDARGCIGRGGKGGSGRREFGKC